ncbi:cephalosporin-C deacetylase-like acetyl esterase [Mucilaginibacter yixingensis]|uniref:Cephalosporin-C deacetylase-like acetyl esterase n=1 Tax=Mucilaginibacter yixingensis TaxID=1295612 RepID=A0A2T5J4Y1_9SPHI|nr:acetylxylan esterase [Mucilaginibacter yixingensis]PTQ92886.1 cephalosporin-C deacetylase-like acetyl esterase [Mucilaginibacter yixingensis]
MFKRYKALLLFITTGFLWLNGLNLNACFAQEGKKDEEHEDEVYIEVDPRNKNAIFNDDDDIGYKIKVKSTYKETQDGKLSYDLLTDENKLISTHSLPVHLTHNSSDSYNITLPHQKAGFYRLNMRFNFTSYDDTVKRVFGVSPLKLHSELHRPDDFEAFWKGTLVELKKVPPQYKVIERKDLSTKYKTVYLVEMRSYQNYLIRGWLVVPTFGRRLPVHYRVPGYGVEMHPNMDADDFVAFDLNVRGSGNSQDSIKLNTDIYSTHGLEDRDNYIYRGAYMDCIRGLDFLASHPKLKIDTTRIFVEGGSQGGALGIMVAALDKRVKALTVQVPLYSDIRDTYAVSATYDVQVFPFKMFRKYHDSHPGYTWDEFYKVFDYYDPQNFAPMVKCPVLMGIGLLDLYCPPRSSMSMYNHLGTKDKEYITVANSTHEVNFNYFMFQNNWLREKLRVP